MQNPVTGLEECAAAREVGPEHPAHGTLRPANARHPRASPRWSREVRAVRMEVGPGGRAGTPSSLPAASGRASRGHAGDPGARRARRCGAPALVAAMRPGMRIAVLGQGRAGRCVWPRRGRYPGKGQLPALDISEKAPRPRRARVSDVSPRGRDPRGGRARGGAESADGAPATWSSTARCPGPRWRPSSPPGTAARPSSSMATSFTAAALGPRVSGSDLTMLVGTVRPGPRGPDLTSAQRPRLRDFFAARYL
jgi:hypothetical protein